MGFFSDQAGALLSKVTGSQDQHNLLSSVLGLINRPEVGGVQGLVDKFKAAGLGHLADGWVAQGPNPPVSPGELQKVFSPDQLSAFAQKLGINPEEATKHLAALLPGVVDHLTPNGTVPQGGIDTAAVLGALKAKLFGGSEEPAAAETV
jgi:uncharacterized protein YidB (DUF937 family)